MYILLCRYLSGNLISTLQNGTFDGLDNLIALLVFCLVYLKFKQLICFIFRNLNDNLINNIETGIFISLKNLTSL